MCWLNPIQRFSDTNITDLADLVGQGPTETVDMPNRQVSLRFLRVITIISIAISGVILLLLQVTSVNGLFLIAPGWASISLVIGVSAIGIDRFFGFSTAWMRHLHTELLIQRLLQSLSVDWEYQCIALEDRSPSKEEVQRLVMMCKEFLSKTNDIVLNETDEWVAEFRGNITDLDAAFEMSEGKK
jgi:hypothetical protein